MCDIETKPLDVANIAAESLTLEILDKLYDDLVSDEDNYGEAMKGKYWAYVCEEHSRSHGHLGHLVSSGCDGCICGVIGCSQVAENYLDIYLSL